MIIRSMEHEIQNLWQNYEATYNDHFLEHAYNQLIIKQYWTLVEYNFLCWLNRIKKYPININTPSKPEIFELETSNFEYRFLNSGKRMTLYKNFLKFLENLKVRFPITSFIALMGGSFSDSSVTEPRDLDLIILTPNNANLSLHESYLYPAKMVPPGIDVKLLPIDYSLDKFKAYSNIMTLGNNVHSKLEPTTNNFYTKRNLFKISF